MNQENFLTNLYKELKRRDLTTTKTAFQSIWLDKSHAYIWARPDRSPTLSCLATLYVRLLQGGQGDLAMQVHRAVFDIVDDKQCHERAAAKHSW